jgi:hypothetical protein
MKKNVRGIKNLLFYTGFKKVLNLRVKQMGGKFDQKKGFFRD